MPDTAPLSALPNVDPVTGPATREIRQLPPHLVNQIAAGEVIERPASVVKELLENSIDAGSHRIELTIEGGGIELIRVSDDGCGIPPEQLPLAVTSHATSKLPDDESLFHVGTLGFRGEALASIASVSQTTIRSRCEGQSGGGQIDVRGGVVESPGPCGCPVGTVIEVRNLFFNTPVRRKFLKTAQTERGHIVEAFTRLALANPKVHFVLRSGEREMYDLLPTTRWADRIEAFFGTDVCDALIPVESDDGPIQVTGYVCDPSVSRGNNRMQYLFLNGRHIRDRALQHALGEAYRGMLMVGRHPICFLRLTMPADLIDVNVHPAKLEVRFTDSGRVYSRLLQSIRQRFLATDIKHRVGVGESIQGDAPEAMSPASAGSIPTGLEEVVLGLPAEAQRQEVIAWARGDQPSAASVPPFRPFSDQASVLPSAAAMGNASPTDSVAPWDTTEPAGDSIGVTPHAAALTEPAVTPQEEVDDRQSQMASPSFCYLGFQIHNRYLVTQDQDGMIVVDQHALHERVLYERVCEKVLGNDEPLERQQLLVPEPVTLTPAERTAALEHAEVLTRIGLDVEDFGDGTLVIHSYPAMLPKRPPAEMLRTLLESVLGAGRDPDPKDILNRLLSTIACKAAVKAGDPLTPEEITSLLEQKDLYHDTHHCPHGRPTALFFSRKELDRMFGRMGHRSV